MVLCAAYILGNLNQNAIIAMLIIILARVDISIAEIHSNEKQYVSAKGVAQLGSTKGCVNTSGKSTSARSVLEYLSVIMIGKGRNARSVLWKVYKLQVSAIMERKNTGAASATNPQQVLTNCMLASLPVVNATLGELSTVDLEFVGGVYSEVTS